jgi:hypothetical protein
MSRLATPVREGAIRAMCPYNVQVDRSKHNLAIGACLQHARTGNRLPNAATDNARHLDELRKFCPSEFLGVETDFRWNIRNCGNLHAQTVRLGADSRLSGIGRSATDGWPFGSDPI